MRDKHQRSVPALALVACAHLLACGEINPIFVDGAPVDGVATDAPDLDAPTDASTDAMDAVPGSWIVSSLAVVNTSQTEGTPSATLDNRELYFFRSTSEGTATVLRLFESTRGSEAAVWGTPIPAVSSGGFISPEVSGDGLELYFTVALNGQLGVYRRAARTDAWPSSAEPLTGWLTGPGGISLSGDSLVAYYANTNGNARLRRRISVAATWGVEEIVPGIDDATRYRNVSITADGFTLVLSSPVVASDPRVVFLTRPSTSAQFGGPLVPVELNDVPALEACDFYAGPDHIYCHRDAGGGNLDVVTADRVP